MCKGLLAVLILFLAFPLFYDLKAAENTEQLKRELEEQIRQKQQEINNYQQEIQKNRSKAKSLQNDISLLENEIDKYRAEISQLDLVIRRNTLEIDQLDEEIKGLRNTVAEKKDILSEYIRVVSYYDKEALFEVMLKNKRFSDFFDQLNALETVQEKIHSALASLREAKSQMEEDKLVLEEERQEQNRLKSFQLVQKNTVESKQNQKENLLGQTKGEEDRYQRLIKGKENEIGHIKEQLSLLEKYNLSLDNAVQYAILAGSRTGIRPAYLLGVLEAESRLGLNVGTGNWREDMYQCYLRLGYTTTAEKQKNAFLQICRELGLNPDLQPVSAEPWYGCGGAMGIAQFMPATWLAYKDQVAGLTGHSPPSPWRPEDAFMAAAIKLSNGGANQRTEIGERTAYAKYLAGGNYQKWIYHKVTDYVINLTGNFQSQYFD